MNWITLESGLSILLHKMPNTHSITVGIYIKSGAGYESQNEKGITHLLEHLHFRRCGNLSQKELYYRMESIGANLYGKTYLDFMQFSMKVTPDKIEDCLMIFNNLISANEWSDEEYEKELHVVLNQIREREQYYYIEDEVKKCF